MRDGSLAACKSGCSNRHPRYSLSINTFHLLLYTDTSPHDIPAMSPLRQYSRALGSLRKKIYGSPGLGIEINPEQTMISILRLMHRYGHGNKSVVSGYSLPVCQGLVPVSLPNEYDCLRISRSTDIKITLSLLSDLSTSHQIAPLWSFHRV